MRKTSPLMKILPIAVLAAVLFYFAVQLYNYLSDPVSTTLVTEGQAEDTIALNGWLLRDEEVLPAQSGTLSRERQEGDRVGVGQVLATVYADDGALGNTFSETSCGVNMDDPSDPFLLSYRYRPLFSSSSMRSPMISTEYGVMI